MAAADFDAGLCFVCLQHPRQSVSPDQGVEGGTRTSARLLALCCSGLLLAGARGQGGGSPWKSLHANDTRCRGCRTPYPPPPGRPPPLQSPGAACSTRSPWKSPCVAEGEVDPRDCDRHRSPHGAIEYHTQNLAIGLQRRWVTGWGGVAYATSGLRIIRRGTLPSRSSTTLRTWRFRMRWVTGRGREGKKYGSTQIPHSFERVRQSRRLLRSKAYFGYGDRSCAHAGPRSAGCGNGTSTVSPARSQRA